MEKDYYKLKDVLLAFRKEYKKEEKKLKHLKQYVDLKDNRVNDLYFYLSNDNETNDIVLKCQYIKNENNVYQKIIKYISSMGYNVNINNEGIVIQNDCNKVIISSRYKTIINNATDFMEETQSLLATDFIKNININFLQFNEQNFEYILNFNYEGITFLAKPTFEKENGYFIKYIGKDDQLSFDYSNKSISIEDEQQNFFIKALDIKIPKKLLSPYHINIIESSKNRFKEIEFLKSNYFLDRVHSYDIDDISKKGKILLKKATKDL